MKGSIRFVFAVALLCLPGALWAEKPGESGVAATVETTLKTSSGHIRQFAFDGDPATYFASEQNPTRGDYFALVFDKPVAVTSLKVTTGKPEGGDILDAGSLEVSADGKRFEEAAVFKEGVASARLGGRKFRALRIKPAVDLKHALAIREITIESDPKVTVFQYPVEFVIDVSDAPEMKEWAEKVARICERQYPLLNEDLKSDGFRPRTVVTMALTDMGGVAATSGGHIIGSAKYFKAHPDDVGAMVHETVHVVQDYGGRRNPGWLVEGIADYERFFKYEPGKVGRLNADRDHYNSSYRPTAAFLAYVTDRYNKDLVRTLNAKMRQGKYKEELFKELTGKAVQELDEEWRQSLKKKS